GSAKLGLVFNNAGKSGYRSNVPFGFLTRCPVLDGLAIYPRYRSIIALETKFRLETAFVPDCASPFRRDPFTVGRIQGSSPTLAMSCRRSHPGHLTPA